MDYGFNLGALALGSSGNFSECAKDSHIIHSCCARGTYTAPIYTPGIFKIYATFFIRMLPTCQMSSKPLKYTKNGDR